MTCSWTFYYATLKAISDSALTVNTTSISPRVHDCRLFSLWSALWCCVPLRTWNDSDASISTFPEASEPLQGHWLGWRRDVPWRNGHFIAGQTHRKTNKQPFTATGNSESIHLWNVFGLWKEVKSSLAVTWDCVAHPDLVDNNLDCLVHYYIWNI